MSTRPALRPSAAPAAVIRSGAGRRSPDSAIDRLERYSAKLDVLIRDMRLGARSQREVDQMIQRGEAIADGIRAIFRLPAAAAQQVNAPLWQDGEGKAIF